ncbi:MAG: hypothetical protein PHX86_03695 [Caldisericia bacterium]|nr:hypothetical protein [Caldisericia bacterium]
MNPKSLVAIVLLFLISLGGVSCRVQSDIDLVSLDTAQFRNGRVALYATYDKATEKMVNWTQHSVFRQEYDRIEYRIEHVGLTNQEFKQYVLQENPPSLFSYHVYRVETEADDQKETQTSMEKQLLYKGLKKRKCFYAYNYTAASQKIRRVYVGDQCFEKELLSYLMCAFPLQEKSSITLRWVDTRIPRQAEGNDAMEGTVSVIVDQIENVQAKGNTFSAVKLLIPSWEMVVWVREESPHIVVKVEDHSEVTVLTDWNEI